MQCSMLGLICLVIFFTIRAAPARDSRQMILVPARYGYPPNVFLRGPFDFIGNWIQGSQWFPIEINVPDTFGAVGNAVGNVAQGVGSFAQGVGNNISGFAQNIGQGFQTLSQNVGNGLQNFAQFFSQRPNSLASNPVAIIQTTQPLNVQPQQQAGDQQIATSGGQQKFLILVPMGAIDANGQQKQNYPFIRRNQMPLEDMIFETFP